MFDIILSLHPPAHGSNPLYSSRAFLTGSLLALSWLLFCTGAWIGFRKHGRGWQKLILIVVAVFGADRIFRLGLIVCGLAGAYDRFSEIEFSIPVPTPPFTNISADGARQTMVFISEDGSYWHDDTSLTSEQLTQLLIKEKSERLHIKAHREAPLARVKAAVQAAAEAGVINIVFSAAQENE